MELPACVERGRIKIWAGNGKKQSVETYGKVERTIRVETEAMVLSLKVAEGVVVSQVLDLLDDLKEALEGESSDCHVIRAREA